MVVRLEKTRLDENEMTESEYYEKEDYKYGPEDESGEIPLWNCVHSYCGFLVLYILGHLRDFLERYGFLKNKRIDKDIPGFRTLLRKFESFYIRNVYMRARGCFERVVNGCPGVVVNVMDRYSNDGNFTFKYTGKVLPRLINMGSYNYLNFAQPGESSPTFDAVAESIRKYGLGTCSSYSELGEFDEHFELNRRIAGFVGTEAAISFPMGFATNALNIPCLMGKGDLIISDQLNHMSLIVGSRLSGTTIKIFKANDMDDLERLLRHSIIYGQPRTHRPYNKILIVVEGIYSMDGTILKLPRLLQLKRQYKAYLFVDEAHSIGALGVHGGGVCDYWNVDPKEIDVLMGTFTKSFAGCGGYIAGSHSLINHIRNNSCFMTTTTMPVPVATQISHAIKEIQEERGIERLKSLKRNLSYFRRRLKEMGFLVYGHRDSPVIPVIFSGLSKINLISQHSLANGLALVMVASPATSLIGARVRFCMSSGHTREMLDKTLDVMDEMGDMFTFKIGK